MSFRLPTNLEVKQQYIAVTPGDVATLENSLLSNSRMLVGLVFAERYSSFEEDCLLAEATLQATTGLSMWPELNQFITPDENGEPIVWVSYLSSPAWWTFLLIILGGIFILPIISVLPVWIIDKMFPGFTEIISAIAMIMVLGGVMFIIPKMLPKEEKK